MPGQKTPGELLEAFGHALTAEAQALLNLLTRYCTYTEFHDQGGGGKPLGLDTFMAMLKLAACDLLFSAMEDEQKAKLLAARLEDRDATEMLNKLRRHPVYDAIQQRVLEGLELMRSGDLEEWMKQMEGRVSREVVEMMSFSDKPRDRLKAAAELLDRISPKKSRGEGAGQVVIMLPPGHAEEAERTMKIINAKSGEAEELISAGRLNVPQLEE